MGFNSGFKGLKFSYHHEFKLFQLHKTPSFKPEQNSGCDSKY